MYVAMTLQIPAQLEMLMQYAAPLRKLQSAGIMHGSCVYVFITPSHGFLRIQGLRRGSDATLGFDAACALPLQPRAMLCQWWLR
jgi:hypothetical protein